MISKMKSAALASLVALTAVAGLASQAEASPYWGDPCQGVIDGTWGYKGGRAMTLTVSRNGWGSDVTVVVSQKNGSEVTYGQCQENYDGSASISFHGQYNSGHVYVSRSGQVSGNVANYSFRGYKD